MDVPASNWNESDASNTTAAPDGAPEGMAPSGVNNVLRAHQGAIKRWYNWTIPLTTGGSGAAYTLTYGVAPGALADGMTHLVQFHAANGASATLNINGLGDIPLRYWAGDWVALPAGVVVANMIARVAYHTASGTYRILGLSPIQYHAVKTFSAENYIEFTGIPETVNHLVLKLKASVSTSGAVLGLQTAPASGTFATGASDYGYSIISGLGGSVVNSSATSSNRISLSGPIATTTPGISTTVAFQGIQETGLQAIAEFHSSHQNSSSSVFATVIGSGGRAATGRISGIRPVMDLGTMTGRATLIGYL